MAGLVNYGSSDEEDNVQDPSSKITIEKKPTTPQRTNGIESKIHTNGSGNAKSEPDAPLVGPALRPTDATDTLPEFLDDEDIVAPQSPYSKRRALLRDLTLPTAPNYDIPPSPPGSPMESTNARFKQFLELKKRGVHFNEKLAKSSSMKNPSLMRKLMDFSDINEAAQYATTLPKDLWNPKFPPYAYKEDLLANQKNITKKREEEKARGQRESVDFVPTTITGDLPSRSGTPSSGRPTQKATSAAPSAAERIMAGLDRGSRSNSPHVQGTKRKTRFDN